MIEIPIDENSKEKKKIKKNSNKNRDKSKNRQKEIGESHKKGKKIKKI